MNINSKCKAVMLANGATSVPRTCPLHGMMKCPEVERATPAAASAGAAGTIDTPTLWPLLSDLMAYGSSHDTEDEYNDARAALVAHIDQHTAAAIAEIKQELAETKATLYVRNNTLALAEVELAALRAGQAQATEGGDLTDAQIVAVLASLGIDSEKSKHGFDVLQVHTTVPGIRDIVNAYRAATAPVSAAPTGKFKIGDTVRKTKGSQWSGEIVGTYSTSLTPEGYAVESSTERGSVQIYPAAALELVSAGAPVSAEDQFCDANCVWTDHAPGCVRAEAAPVSAAEDEKTTASMLNMSDMTPAAIAEEAADGQELPKPWQDRVPANYRGALDAAPHMEAEIAEWRALAMRQPQGDDAARLDFIEKSARCDPKMGGNHVWWPTAHKDRLCGPTLRAAIDNAMAEVAAKQAGKE